MKPELSRVQRLSRGFVDQTFNRETVAMIQKHVIDKNFSTQSSAVT